MKGLRRLEKLTLAVLASTVAVLMFSLHYYKYDEFTSMVKDTYRPGQGPTTIINHNLDDLPIDQIPPTTRIGSLDKSKKLIIYPRHFHLNTTEQLIDHYTKVLKKELPKSFEILKYHYKFEGIPTEEELDEENFSNNHFVPHDQPVASSLLKSNALSSSVLSTKYHAHGFDVFNTNTEIYSDPNKCSLLYQQSSLQVSEPINLGGSRRKIVEQFYYSTEEYPREFDYFFKEHPIKDMLDQNTVDEYWYRLAGSSVYLEQYGVNFMVSRVLYSKWKRRDKPALSFVYGQVFDENWHEVPDVELVVPTNSPDINNVNHHAQVSTSLYGAIQYPAFLPVPAYHKFEINQEGYYGPEDPRVLLVKNPRGYEEPLILFNANHRKIVESEAEDIENTKLKFHEFRSMFVSWPWQFQRGKLNMEDLKSQHNSRLYNRVMELKIRNAGRSYSQQKNWTPFLSQLDRTVYNYDKFLYVAIRWSNLEILKCSLTENKDNSVANCVFDYKLRTPESSMDVGPLRGGTALVNVNLLLNDNLIKFPQLQSVLDRIPAGKEIFIGFARAHFKECGCGKGFYRPNFVTIVKDHVKEGDVAFNVDEMKDSYTTSYKLSHVGSFMSFDVPVIGWDVQKQSLDCVPGSPNSFIPNGISSWSIYNVTEKIDDYLSLSYSVSDYGVDVIHIRGMLNMVLGSLNEKDHHGYNNDNVICAMKMSEQFCVSYGAEHSPPEEPKEETKEEPKKDDNRENQASDESQIQHSQVRRSPRFD